jgi:hypothetical protein
MKEIPEDKSIIRQYLLGGLPEAEQRHVEELFIQDAGYRENVLIAEDELVEDYLEGVLTEQERQKFDEHFLATPQQRRKLRIARSLKAYASGVGTPPAGEGEVPGRDKRRASVRWLSLRNPFTVLPLAAALLIILALGVGRFVELRRVSREREQEQSRRAEVERELDAANAPGFAPGGQVYSFALSPVSVRSGQGRGPVAPPSDANVVDLLLVLIGEARPGYRALLQRVGEPGAYAVGDLRAEVTPAGRVVSVKIPTRLLSRGHYQLQLIGVNADGRAEAVGDYEFQFENRPAP